MKTVCGRLFLVLSALSACAGTRVEVMYSLPERYVIMAVMGSDKIAWVASQTRIWRTQDAGAHWRAISIPEKRMHIIQSLHLSGSNTIWVQDGRDWYISSDEGVTWRKGPAVPITKDDYVASLWFDTELKYGWASVAEGYTDDSARRASAYRTSDGGKHWTRIPLALLGGEWPPGRLYALDRDHVFVFFRHSLLYTFDGGRSWSAFRPDSSCSSSRMLEFKQTSGGTIPPIYSPFLDGGPMSMWFIGQTGWLTDENGYVLKTTDGGATWCDIFPKPEKRLRPNPNDALEEIEFSDALHGWGLSASARLRYTDDGGENWRQVEGPIGVVHILRAQRESVWVSVGGKVFRVAVEP